jgi:endo-1,4-beta-xylanase
MKPNSLTRRDFLRDGASSAAAIAAAHGLPGVARAASAPDSIAAVAKAHGILAGCAVNAAGLANDAEFGKLVAAQSAIVVPENAMKWNELRPTPTTYDYSAADHLVDFARQHGIVVRGHNLCWHEALPRWFAETVNKDNAAQFLTDHIRNVAGHFAGQLQSWDVVNEAIDLKDGREDGLRGSPWFWLLGPGYIDIAFRTARAADPHARLVYNDYGIEEDDAKQARKRDAVFQLARGMQKRGTPIDAVGVQSHLAANAVCGNGLRHFIRDLHKLGLEVYVTEMDVNDSMIEGSDQLRDHAVAETYGKYLDLVLSEGVRLVLTWGLTDRYTWLTNQHSRTDHRVARGLPFDENLQPVEAFHAMVGSFGRAAKS